MEVLVVLVEQSTTPTTWKSTEPKFPTMKLVTVEKVETAVIPVN
jgi:hypothetical protein